MASLTRNPAKVTACMKEMPDGRLLCTQDLKVQIPVRFTECNLAQISIQTIIYGVCALILPNGDYAVMLINAMLNIDPAKIVKVEVNGDEYYEFFFKANTPWLNSTSLVKKGADIYYLVNELFINGKVPWYIDYEDLGKLLDSAAYHADTQVAKSYIAIELMAAIVSRNQKEMTQHYRHIAGTTKEKPAYVPLKSVYYAAGTTWNKLAGAYFSDAVVGALVTPTKASERIDRLLRA